MFFWTKNSIAKRIVPEEEQQKADADWIRARSAQADVMYAAPSSPPATRASHGRFLPFPADSAVRSRRAASFAFR